MIFFFGCEHLYHHYWGLMWSDQKVAGSDPASDVHVSVPTQSHIVAGGLVSTKLSPTFKVKLCCWNDN